MKIPFEKVEKLFKEHNTNGHRVAADLGFSQSLFPRWKAGVSVPKYDKIMKIAEYFNVDALYFYDDINQALNEQNSFISSVNEETLSMARDNVFYNDPEVQMITQEIHDRPEMRGLFNAAKDMNAEDIKRVLAIIEAYEKDYDDED